MSSLLQGFYRLLQPINNLISKGLSLFDRAPRYIQHIIFWIFLGLCTSNQFVRMFAPTPTATPNYTGFWIMWPVHLLMTILSFYLLGYYVVPRFWNKRTAIQFLIIFSLYWLASSYLTVWLFEAIDYYLKPAPAYVVSRIQTFKAATWSDFFTDPALFFYIWAFSFAYVIIPLLIKAKREETLKGAKMVALEQEKLTMELTFLRSQINPHFLFNAFNNLYALIRRGDHQAATILADLSEILRYALYKTSANIVPLKGELLFLVNYIRLESIRFTTNKVISCNLEGDASNYGIPPMIIIPFIENAFKHGLSSSIEKANLTVSIEIDDQVDELQIDIRNSKEVAYKPSREGGIGIANVRKRLDLLMGNNYDLKLTDTSTEFRVNLTIPLYRLDQVITQNDEEPLPFPFNNTLQPIVA